jgi:hypothetical protein
LTDDPITAANKAKMAIEKAKVLCEMKDKVKHGGLTYTFDAKAGKCVVTK